jgi:hypothetical protein
MPDTLRQAAKCRFQPYGKLAVLLELTAQSASSIQWPVDVRIFERFIGPLYSTI